MTRLFRFCIALTYIDGQGKIHRVRKCVPEQILNLMHNKSEIERRVHAVIDKFANRRLRTLVVAYQEVPDGRKESLGGLWQFVGLMPLFDPPRHDSADTIRRALNLGVNVKMITGLHVSKISSVIILQLETHNQYLYTNGIASARRNVKGNLTLSIRFSTTTSF